MQGGHRIISSAVVGILAMACSAGISLAQTAPASTSPATTSAATRPALPPLPTEPTARATELIKRGTDFLKTQQQADGSWQQSEQAPPAITALVLRALVITGTPSSEPYIKKGYEQLLKFQQTDGSVQTGTMANYNTSIAVSALAVANDPAYKEPLAKALAYVRGLQYGPGRTNGYDDPNEKAVDQWNGGFGYGAKYRDGSRPDLSNTQMALEALHDAGVKSDDPAFKASLDFVTRMQNNSETNKGQWVGDDGGFIYTNGKDGNTPDSKAGKYTTPEGAPRFRSYGSMSYAGLKSFVYAGLTKDDPRVQAAWKWVSNNWTLTENPGIRTANPEDSQWGLYYYFNTLAIALNQYDQPIITDANGKTHDWRLELIDKLAELQNADGSWTGNKRWMESDPVLVTSYVVQTLENAREDLAQHPIAEK